ncbi:MAG TPA: LuxR C-terminal-related transcriptional regulator, partial [Solirubrobacteraceae bacterium]|nr:LuxR C-terminal-related transcriptional regulator [Solirubrobacteraceae bacterium]
AAVIESAPERGPQSIAKLALTLEAGIAAMGMMNERTALTALRRAEGLRDRLPELSDPPVFVLASLAYYALRENHAGEALELARRALACEPYPPLLEVSPWLIGTLTMLERYDAVQQVSEDMLAAARRRGAMPETIAISLFRAWASSDRGALADAEADARWALERADGVRRIQAVSELIRVLIERDELQAAEHVLEQLPDPRASRSVEVARFLFVRGRLRSAQRRLDEALEDILECGQRCERRRIRNPSPMWRSEAALAYAALGDTREARRLAGEQLELARAFGRPRALGISLAACGLVWGGDAGLELLAEAVGTLEGAESPLELARARSGYGAALRRAGRRVQARTELELALDLAHRLGAWRIANQARAELIAAGAKPRRDAIIGRDALTAGELRVARLAADGLTNREIAQALFITTMTAKSHLSRVYRKLEITRRGQLAVALAGRLGDSRSHASAAAPSIS